MNIVKIITCDSKIWNVEQVILDITQASFKGPVVIDLLHEGPCNQSINLDHLLNSVTDLKVQSIQTANQIQSSSFPETRFSFVELNMARKKAETTVPSTSSLEKRFAMFIGRSNWQRLGLASYLWKHYKDTALITYHYDGTLDYHKENFGLETLLQKHWNTRHAVYEFLEQLPITLDHQTYPILWNQLAFDLDKHYNQIFCELVCETFFTGKTFMMTEKTMRPIIQRRPFVVQGPKFYLENLKALGFKTFDTWWDESYDIDGPDGQFESIRWTIDYIGKQSPEIISDWYNQMQPVLEHNAKVLSQLTDQQVTTTQFKSE
jgi:hypothetical protein